MLSMARSISNADSTTIPTIVQKMPSRLNRKSCRLRRAIRAVSRRWSSSPISVRLPEALAQQVARDVEDERQREQRQPGGEDRLIGDAAVRQIALADLDDEGGDGGGRLARID